MITLSFALLLGTFCLTALNSAILWATYAQIGTALEPVIGMRAAMHVLTDEISRLAHRLALVSVVGDHVGNLATRAAESKAAGYVKDGVAAVYDRLKWPSTEQ